MQSRNEPCHCGSGKKFKRCHYAVEAAGRRVVQLVSTPYVDGPGIAMLLPTRGNPTIETLIALSSTDGLRALTLPMARKPVVEARNTLVKEVQQLADKAPFRPRAGWYVLWVDDDAFWRPGTIKRMLQSLITTNADVMAGWFCGRKPFAAPQAFYPNGTWPRLDEDCQPGDVVEVARVGFHFVMHKLELLEKLPTDPFTPIPDVEGEDFSFCDRVRQIGGRIFVDTGSIVAHVDSDGSAYIPGFDAISIVGGQIQYKDDAPRSYGLEKEPVVSA